MMEKDEISQDTPWGLPEDLACGSLDLAGKANRRLHQVEGFSSADWWIRRFYPQK